MSIRTSESDILSALTLHKRKQNWIFFIFVINGNQIFLSQTYRIVGPLGEKLDFFSPLRFEPKSEFGHETSKLNPHSIRASERNLNDKNLIHGQKRVINFSI